jgi:hypothetical protein
MIKKIAAAVLVLLGVAMVFIGVRAGIAAPVVTGVGFFVIAVVFGIDSQG